MRRRRETECGIRRGAGEELLRQGAVSRAGGLPVLLLCAALLLCAVLLAGALPVRAAEEESGVLSPEMDGPVGAAGAQEEAAAAGSETISGMTRDGLNFTLAGGVLTVSGDGVFRCSAIADREKADLLQAQTREAVLEEGVTSIGWGGFQNFTALEGIALPSTLTGISGKAFAGCTALTAVQIPDAVTSLGAGTFAGCTSLSAITLPQGPIGGMDRTTFSGTPWAAAQQQNGMLIVQGVLLEADAASGTLHVPEGVTQIGAHALEGCTALTAVELPDSLREIGASALAGCTSLQAVELPAAVREIGAGAFSGCSALTEVHFAAGGAQVADDAFEGTPWEGGRMTDGMMVIDGVLVRVSGSPQEVTIPSTVRRIGSHVFENQTALRRVVIPDSVREIGSRAFAGCTELLQVSAPDSVDWVEQDAFAGTPWLQEKSREEFTIVGGVLIGVNASLSEVTVPDRVRAIAPGAFSGSRAVTVTIPSSVRRIDASALREAQSLREVNYGGTLRQWEALTGGSAVAASVQVNARPEVPVQAIVMEKKVTGFAGEKRQLTAEVTPADNTEGELIWKSSDERVAKVSAQGELTCVSGGCARVTAQSPVFGTLSNACTVTVLFDDLRGCAAWKQDAVEWGLSQGITSGTSAQTFSPEWVCTREQIVVFLYRLAGSPQVKKAAMPFSDVREGAYYHDAVAWALQRGITSGVTRTAFGVGQACTRAQIVAFLYRFAGSPAVSGGLPFSDVRKSWQKRPVAWAAGQGITSGKAKGCFGPEDPCTRAQAMRFLQVFSQKAGSLQQE